MSLKTDLEKSDNIQYDVYLKGLSEETVRRISLEQNEPERMLQLRLHSLKIYNQMPMPAR